MPKSSRARKRKIPELFFFLLLEFYNAHRITKLCYCFTAVYNISFLNSSSRSTLVHALLLTLFYFYFFRHCSRSPNSIRNPSPNLHDRRYCGIHSRQGVPKTHAFPFPKLASLSHALSLMDTPKHERHGFLLTRQWAASRQPNRRRLRPPVLTSLLSLGKNGAIASACSLGGKGVRERRRDREKETRLFVQIRKIMNRLGT